MQNGHTFAIIINDVTYDLTDLVNYGVVEFDGMGMPTVRRLVQRGPLQNGDTDVGFRLDPRIIRMSVIAYGGNDVGIMAKRAQLLRMMKPRDDAMQLRWTFDGVARQIDVHYNGGMSFPSTDWRLAHHRAVFELRASDPTWYLVEPSIYIWSNDGGGSGFAFPLQTPFTFGASVINGTYNIQLVDDASWETFPLIRIYGRINNPVLKNNNSGDILDFTGNNVSVGQYIEIDLRYGYKTVNLWSSGTATNWVSLLTAASDLATWSLKPGDNVVNLTGTNADSTTRVELFFNERLIGV